MGANLNPTFKKELEDRKIIVQFNDSFKLTPYELNQIRFWLNVNRLCIYETPSILPVSKRFALDFIDWDKSGVAYLINFKKKYFIL